MLAFENELFLECMSSSSCLTVAAKGLGLDDVFLSLLRVYADPGNLVLVMGADESEEETFLARLDALEEGVKKRPRRITAEVGVKEREKVYKEVRHSLTVWCLKLLF